MKCFFEKREINFKGGYTLMEILVYFAIFSAVSVFAMGALFSTLDSFSRLAATQQALSSGQIAMDRIVYEIRRADEIDTGASAFGVNPGELVLKREASGSNVDTRFFIDSGILKIEVDDAAEGALTRDNSNVTNLVFRRLEAKHAGAVKINMTVRGESGGETVEKSFQDTILLRNNGN